MLSKQARQEYSNEYLKDRVRKVLEDCGAERVPFHLEHEETVRRFIERLEDVYRRSRENPVWLGVGPDPRKKKETLS